LEKEQEKDPSQTARKAGGVECLPEGILPKEPKKIIKIYAKVAKREPRQDSGIHKKTAKEKMIGWPQLPFHMLQIWVLTAKPPGSTLPLFPTIRNFMMNG
jgi:hypothetical protein